MDQPTRDMAQTAMNQFFRGSYSNGGIIYDYSCTCYPESGGIRWEATVQNSSVVCKPTGRVAHVAFDTELLRVISGSIENAIERAHALARAA
jgi:hypothetical protein